MNTPDGRGPDPFLQDLADYLNAIDLWGDQAASPEEIDARCDALRLRMDVETWLAAGT